MEQPICGLKKRQAENIGHPNVMLDMMNEWKGMSENLLKSLADRSSDIESREKTLSLATESLEKRTKDLEERERDFNLFRRRKRKELALKEIGLSPMWEEFEKEIGLREEKLDEQLKMVHNHIESLEVAQSEVEDLRLRQCEKLREIEKREREVDPLRGSLERRLREVDQREREVDSLLGSFAKQLREVEQREREVDSIHGSFQKRLKEVELREREVDSIRGSFEKRLREVEQRERKVDSICESFEKSLREIEKREREVDFIHGSFEKRLREVEQREKEVDSFRDERLRELALKEELLSRKREQFQKEVKLANGKFREGEKLGCNLVKRLELALNMLESMKAKVDERFKEIKSWEAVAHKSLSDSLNEADLIRESLEKQFKEFEKMETEFNSLQEDKMQKLESKERQLRIMMKENLMEVKFWDEKLTEQRKLGHQLLESLKEMVAKKLKEIESQELAVNVARETLDASSKDADLKRESAKIQLQELERKEEEFHLYQEKRMRELVSAEEKFRSFGKEFMQDIKFREEKFDKQEKLMHGLLQRLELAINNVMDMNAVVNERFKKIGLKEINLNDIRVWAKTNMDELEFTAKALWGQKKGIKVKEEFEGKKKEFELKEGCLASQRKEPECKGQHLEELDRAQQNLNSVRELTQTCFKENLALNKLHQLERYLVENRAGYLAEKDKLAEYLLGELESKGRQMGVHFKDLELKQQQLTDALDTHLRIEPDESVDLKHAVQMDGKILEMFINGAEKDMALMGDEFFKVLFQSSDPAKLVLDAIEGFYRSYLGRGDMEFYMRIPGIVLLDQLTRMSPNIQPCLREAAIELASEWKSKIRTAAENPLEVLGFLHLLAAYNLASCFDTDELLSLLKTVAQHKQTPELFQVLGLTENIPGFIQNLINEKQYLLASMYIHESELENMFPQAAVMDYYVKHSKMAAKAKCKGENNSSEAQDKAIVSEIADLHVAIEHIIKYGLESEHSLDALTARIKQLERDRASLKSGMPSSSADLRKQENNNISARPQDANKRKAQQKQHELNKEAAPAPKAQYSEQGSQAGSSHAWRPQGQNKRKKHRTNPPVSFHEPWSQQGRVATSLQLTELLHEELVIHPFTARKRRRTNILLHEREFCQENLHHPSSLPGDHRWRY